MTLSCRMLLHDLDGEAIDRDECLSSAREIASLAKLWIRQMHIDDLKDQHNPKLTNRHKNGLAGPYVLSPWYWTADRLVRGAKLLRMECKEKGAWARKSIASSLTPRRGWGMCRRSKDDH